MKKTIKTLFAAGLTAGVIATSGCSVVSTPPDQVSLWYEGGAFSSRKFVDCVPVSTREVHGPGDKYYSYPTSLRTYDASDDKKAERGPITVVSKDNAEMRVPVSITFTLITDCETLRKFHETIGNRNNAFWGGSDFEEDNDQNKDGTPDGWIDVLNFYVGKVLDTSLDRGAQAYEWRQLWNDPKIKAELEQQLEAGLSETIDERMGGHFFEIDSITLQKPDPVNTDLKDAVANEQAAVAKAKALEVEAQAKKKSAVAEAEAKQAQAEAEIAVAKAEAAQIREQIRVMGKEAWLRKYAIDNGVTPWPNPVVPGANGYSSQAK